MYVFETTGFTVIHLYITVLYYDFVKSAFWTQWLVRHFQDFWLPGNKLVFKMFENVEKN